VEPRVVPQAPRRVGGFGRGGCGDVRLEPDLGAAGVLEPDLDLAQVVVVVGVLEDVAAALQAGESLLGFLEGSTEHFVFG